mgnify:CR=1 FL=1
MKSIREIYKTGKGPSSSHTMGPERAANYFKNAHPQADGFRVILYGSLSKTGVGHGTDRVLREVLAPVPTEIVFSDEALPASAHPNTMDLIALKNGAEADRLRVESIGGGDIRIQAVLPVRRIPRVKKSTWSIPSRRSPISANGATSRLSATTWS